MKQLSELIEKYQYFRSKAQKERTQKEKDIKDAPIQGERLKNLTADLSLLRLKMAYHAQTIADLERLRETLAQEQYNRLANLMQKYSELEQAFSAQAEQLQDQEGVTGTISRATCNASKMSFAVVVSDLRKEIGKLNG